MSKSVLYHASPIKNLREITPQRTLSNDKYIGNYVFATRNKLLAIMYLVPKGFAYLMNPESESPNIVICADTKELKANDKGGVIYELPGNSFTESPQKEISEYEMVSKHPVKPLNKTVYKSTMDALLSAGIEIRLTDKDCFYKLIKHPDQKRLIKKLKVYEP